MITTAIQKTSQSVWVYNESGSARQYTGHLVDYTSNTVIIRPLSALHSVNVYDDKGRHLQTIPC
jgi:hypothetical protein